ncbi:MAG: helix-turn-helix transcriptional regulator [Cyclobacteriaceae bacterium]|nr:helix-turn-helix transcriptional regulator [Cyclobacteriaceae bacterium]
MNILYSASGVLSILFIILLLSKKEKRVADYILSGWFLIMLLVIIATYIHYNHIDVWQGLFKLTDSSAFLLGPLVLFYTLAMTKENFEFQRKDLWHLLPFFISTIYQFSNLWDSGIGLTAGHNFNLIAKMMISLVYGIGALVQLSRHKRNIANYFSNTDKVKLNWLKLLIWSLLIIWVISALSLLLYYIGEVSIPQYGGFFTNLALSIFVFIIGYFGIRQPAIFVPAQLNENIENSKDPSLEAKKITNETGKAPQEESSLSHKRYQRLLKFMESEQPYLDSQLTVYNLAAQMHLSPHHLSQLINRQSGSSFFDFVNRYRVEEVKDKIRDNKHYRQTLLAVALDCGFNSKSSFNRVFKKMTEQTPMEFVKTLE